jgi:hypothetical protein
VSLDKFFRHKPVIVDFYNEPIAFGLIVVGPKLTLSEFDTVKVYGGSVCAADGEAFWVEVASTVMHDFPDFAAHVERNPNVT